MKKLHRLLALQIMVKKMNRLDAGNKLKPIPITLREANQFVLNFHRHNKPVQGGRFAIAACFDDAVVGVAIVGRPVSATLQDGVTAELTRLCVNEDAPKNTCSFLYGRCWRIWQQMRAAHRYEALVGKLLVKLSLTMRGLLAVAKEVGNQFTVN